MVAVLGYLFSTFLLWLPCLQITGYNYMDALVYSNNLSVRKKGPIFLALFLPALVCFAARLLIVAFVPFSRPRFSLSSSSSCFYPVFCVLMFVAYFDAAGEERMDLKKKI